MKSQNIEENTSPSMREDIIKNISFFSIFSPIEIIELAKLMEDCRYQAGEVIVQEGEVVDSIYLIISGRAEVSTETNIEGQKSISPVCVLGENETIGLSKEGFFSTTGIRFATVTALTNIHLLRLSLHQLHQFLRKQPLANDKLRSVSEQMLYMNFIKQLYPFASLTPAIIQTLAKSITKTNHTAGEIIFRQGDSGDECYLIASGQVEIILISPEGKERILATLNPSELFGEQAVLMDMPRSATARAVANVTLLSINREVLNALFLDEEQVRTDIVSIMMERQRPIKKDHVLVYKNYNTDGELIVTLKDTLNRNYYRLSPRGLFIWEKLDGDHSFQDITMDFFKEFKQFSPQSIYDLVIRLAHDGFVNVTIPKSSDQEKDLPFWIMAVKHIRQIMEYRIAVNDPDKRLTEWYNNGVHWLFTWPVQIFCFSLLIMGMVAFISFSSHVAFLLEHVTHVAFVLLYLFIAMLLVIPLHELGHAFATKYFGREVSQFGIGWFWLRPIAYTDTSDMWLCGKWPRVVVNFAGVYVDGILAGLAAILAYLCHNPHISVFLWLYAAVCYYNILFNLNPTQEFDGYYVLMDLLEKPNLRESSITWLIKKLSRSSKPVQSSSKQNPELMYWISVLSKHNAEVIYWIATLIFLFVITYAAYLFQVHVLEYLLPAHISSRFGHVMRLLLPFAVIILSSIGILAEVKRKAFK